MADCQLLGNVSSHGLAPHVCFINPQHVHKPGCVISLHLDGVWYVRSIGSTHATVVERYYPIPPGELGSLQRPTRQVTSQAHYQKKWFTFPLNLAVHVDITNPHLWHGRTLHAVRDDVVTDIGLFRSNSSTTSYHPQAWIG